MMKKVFEQVLETIEKHKMISKNEHIVIGLSGGPDSVCLFDVLLKLKDELNLHIYPVHVNHKFRPGAAEEDQRYVENLCKSQGLECRSFEVDCNKLAEELKVSSEEAGRMARYDAFEKVAKEVEEKFCVNSIKIAVAQNADDRAETVLFRLLRGTGTDGISSIKYTRVDKNHRTIIRPLLDVYKEDILLYCKNGNLNPCIDKTNEEPIYTRNKIRLELIPYLEDRYNNNIKEALNRLADAALEDRLYLEKLSTMELERCILSETESDMVLDGNKIRMLDIAIRRRVIGLSLVRLGLAEDVTAVHYENCENVIFNDNPSASTDLPKGYYFRRIYDNIEVGFNITDEGNRDFNMEVGHNVVGDNRVLLDEKKLKLEECYKCRVLTAEEYGKLSLPKGSFCAFDYDALLDEFGTTLNEILSLRNRREGDVMSFPNGTKKIKKILIDDKVPKAHRDKVLILAIGNQVLWIKEPGNRCRYTAKYKVNNRTKNVICIEFISAT